ncbi:DUF6114 domain-containing protein [Streptomyces sp. NBC_01803]|uniref:DUF6114 domain-containing protein n=1 Tax=Streptomyces sp. NBC_01803 TaxID=2975946 RepID=UPI002DDC20EF|nr:DUF6114 domain-containing protein [Streptomyces sp. NBC_01803]WSA47537.1 DUF6114 domain-containing protein [Streptomyces sp. NBC_01803]
MSLFTRARLAFRAFRWRRPFWAGLFTMIAGLPIAWFPYRGVTFGDLTIRMATTAGAGSLVIGGLLLVLGLTMWFQPHVRIFAGAATILLALVSLIVSNFGGFFMGFLAAMIGGALSVAWVPGERRADAEQEETWDREPPDPAPGAGGAPAGFQGAAPGLGKDPWKGKHRAE